MTPENPPTVPEEPPPTTPLNELRIEFTVICGFRAVIAEFERRLKAAGGS